MSPGAARRVVIVGGGITGLAAAHALERASREPSSRVAYTLVEAGDRLGGNLRTERVGDFLIDAGPDGFVASKPHAAALCREVGLGARLMGTIVANRRVYFAHRGALVPLPEGMMLAAPARLGPLLRSPLFPVRARLRIALDLVKRARRASPDDEESIAQFVGRRLGDDAAELVAEPLLAGIYAGDPRLLSVQATFPQLVAMEQKHGSLIRGARAARREAAERTRGGPPPSAFLTLPNGMGSLVEAVAARLRAGAVKLGSRASALSRGGVDNASWTVHLASGEALPADRVLLAVPAYVSARLLEAHDAEAAATLLEIPYLSTAVAFFAYRRAQVAHPLDASGCIVPRRERMNITAATFISSKYPGRAPADTVLLRAFLGGARAPELLDRDDDALLECAREDLATLLGLRGTPVLERVYRYHRANPQPMLGHLARIRRLKARLAALPGLHAAGGGYEGVGIPDCIKQGEALAEAALAVRPPVLRVLG